MDRIIDLGNGEAIRSSAYTIYQKPCPYCNTPCDADHVDVGVGMVQCGPYHCESCLASEIHPYDTRKLTEKEEETGWYEPHTPVSEHANTVMGALVDHKTAKKAYRLGLLDSKPTLGEPGNDILPF